ncbi:hypothetical protein F5Y11DRAFT_351991 [Daldinia sp. FL1419]|nr:hypothetical protein F5Y11DRAFT_351991 [Daldinia sp. FL1419]
MADDSQSPGLPEGSLGRRFEGRVSRGRRRSTRRPGMPEAERRSRQERRRRFHNQFGSIINDNLHRETGRKPTSDDLNTARKEIEHEREHNPVSIEAERIQERKPWETLVIGSLGENLSYIEEKNREIERQQFIVRYHTKHSPHEVPHNQAILDDLMRERLEMEDNEENNIPQDVREEKKRIGERLDSLNWALDTCQCEDEAINIRAAIQGYQSGEITYSKNFTLIYGGHITDVCPSYQSFCVDREERLDKYFAAYGPGWLWQEPPLSGPGFEPIANKSVCLKQDPTSHVFGHYSITQRFTFDRNFVMRMKAEELVPDDRVEDPDIETSCCFETLLDSGATYPNLVLGDLKRFNINLKYYAAQGVATIRTVTERIERRFFEMRVEVCTQDGESIVGKGDQAVWPNEPRFVGSYAPVWINEAVKGAGGSRDRLSGMVPFETCYVSSAPTMKRIWLGEDRRDVLGARRMPSLLRFDVGKTLVVPHARRFQELRARARTPDQVIFVHHLEPENGKGRSFVDTDGPGVPGKTQLSLIEGEWDETGREIIQTIQDKQVLEPRAGRQWERQKRSPEWHNTLFSYQDFMEPDYRGVGEKLGARRKFGRGFGDATKRRGTAM